MLVEYATVQLSRHFACTQNPHSFASEHNAEDGTVHHLALTLST